MIDMVLLNDKIKEISEKTGTTEEVLKKEFGEIFADMKSKVSEGTSDDKIQSMATNKLLSSYRKQLLSNGEKFEGIFIGAGGVFDMVKKRRQLLLDKYAEDPEKAIEEKMVEIENDIAYPLQWAPKDDVAKMIGPNEWKKKNLGKRLPETDFKRTLYGVVKTKDGLIKMQMSIRNKNSNVMPKMFSVCTFIGFNLRTSTNEMIYLNDSGLFAPKYTDELSEAAVIDIIDKIYKNDFLELSQVQEFIDSHANEFNPLMISKVSVVELSPMKTKTNSSMVIVADDSIPIDVTFACWIPEDIELDFPETSEIYIVGSPRLYEGKYSISIAGIFVPELYRSMVTATKEDVGKKSEIVGKW